VGALQQKSVPVTLFWVGISGVIDTLIAAVRAGELDEHLNQAANTEAIGKVKKPAKAPRNAEVVKEPERLLPLRPEGT
jgi:hypothetical protein